MSNTFEIRIPNSQFPSMKEALAEKFPEDPINDMDLENFIEMHLDMFLGEIRRFLKWNKFGNISTSMAGGGIFMREVNTDFYSSNSITIETDHAQELIDALTKGEFFKKVFHEIFWDIKLEMEFFLDGKKIGGEVKEIDYSKLGKREIDNLVNKYLDARDFEMVKKLSKFVSEKKVFKFSDWEKLK